MTSPTSRNWEQIEPILDGALERAGEDREAYLRAACPDPVMRERVDRLLAACEPGESVLEKPAFEQFSALLGEAQPSDLPVPSILVGRYRIERLVKRGGMATVYQATDLRNKRPVAVKVLSASVAGAVLRDRFLAEIEIAARLAHPHIVSLYDHDESDGFLFYVMPFIEGESLRERLQRRGPLAIDEAVRVTLQIADALTYAHAAGVIHRDIKPENLLFQAGHVVVCDFGIAQAVNAARTERMTWPGVAVGTVPYMSPEQANGEYDLDEQTDVFSLGCVLYEMLSGAKPFPCEVGFGAKVERFSQPPREVRVHRPSVRPGVSAVLHRAIAVERGDRYPSASAFARALEEAAASMTTEVPPAPRPSRATTFGRRVAIAAVATLLVAALAAGMRFGDRLPWIHAIDPTLTDTTIVVFPLVAEAGSDSAGIDNERLKGGVHDLLIRQGFERWTGLTVIEPFRTALELQRHEGDRRLHLAAIARALGAGRYVRVEIALGRNDLYVAGSLYDSRTDVALARHTVRVSAADLQGAGARYASLADSLLVKAFGSAIGGPGKPAMAGSHSIPALRAMAAAMHALDDWDLAAADSLFARALQHDYSYASAALWIAQVRAWRKPHEPEQWRALARRAGDVDGGVRLTSYERKLLLALTMLGNAAYSDACRVYDELRQRNEKDFIAWYGLGECRRLDRVVLPDPASPSGWRFRSSYHRAVAAYARAFALVPSVYRSYQLSAFAGLRALFLTSAGDIRMGFAVAQDSMRLFGVPVWMSDGDTLAVIPWPADVMSRGTHERMDLLATRKAIDRERALLRDITSGWASSLPRSAGAKMAFGVSLAILGDRGAIDTLTSARTLLRDPPQQLGFALMEVLARARFAGSNTSEIARLRTLADSLLGASNGASPEAARALAPIAALVGRCRQAVALVRRAAPARTDFPQIPQDILREGDALLVTSALGCSDRALATGLDGLSARLASVDLGKEAAFYRHSLLGRAARLLFPSDPAWIRRLSTEYDDLLLRAQTAALAGDGATARSLLRQRELSRQTTRLGEVKADAVLAETRVWLAVGDTATAVTWLDQFFGGVRFATPRSADDLTENLSEAAALGRLMLMRATLPASQPSVAQRWGASIRELWAEADGELQGEVRKMSRSIQ